MKNYDQINPNNPFGSQSKMFYHLDRLAEYRETDDTRAPVFMEVNLTNRCNLRCRWCICKTSRSLAEIKTEPLLTWLAEAKGAGLKAVTWSGGGEPTIHPDFISIVRSTTRIGIEQGLMTNGIDKSILDVCNHFKWVRFSVDTLNPIQYSKDKGSPSLHVVLDNIKKVRSWSDCRIGINCNVSDDLTTGEAIKLIEFANENADYVQFRPILPRYFAHEEYKVIGQDVWGFLSDVDRSKYDIDINLSNDKLLDLRDGKVFDFGVCDGHFFEPIVDANGDVKVCMYHPTDHRFSFGNIYQSNFKDVWTSKRRRDTIDFVRSFNYAEGCQACCKCAEINKLLGTLKTEHKDVNFL